MNFRRLALLVVPVVVMALAARLIRARQPDVWKPNASDLILSADGSRIVGLNDDGTPQSLRVWNSSEHRAMPVQHLTDKKHVFWKLFNVSPHGEWAALLSHDSQSNNTFEWLEIWDLARAPVRRAWRIRCHSIAATTWANGRLTTFENTAVRTYDARGKRLSSRQLAGHAANEVFVPTALSPDAAVVVNGINITLYDAHSGQSLRQLQRPPKVDDLACFSFAPDHLFLMAQDDSTSPPTKLMWNVKTGRLVKPKKPLSGFWAALGHGQIQVDGRVEDVATQRQIGAISLPAGAAATEIQTSVDGKVVISRGIGTVWIRSPR